MQHGFPAESSRDARREFDLRLAQYLHSGMKIIPAEGEASGDVWAFLALVLLPDVSYWRYPAPLPATGYSGPNHPARAGTALVAFPVGPLTGRTRFLQGPRGARRAAFDQIYARRKALGNSPMMVKAILRTWSGLDLVRSRRASGAARLPPTPVATRRRPPFRGTGPWRPRPGTALCGSGDDRCGPAVTPGHVGGSTEMIRVVEAGSGSDFWYL